MKNTADVTGGKPITVLLQSISGVSAINPLVALYDIYGGKREVLFFYFVPDTTRDHIRKTGHNPPRGPSADWWVLTTANAAGTNGLTCLPKHGNYNFDTSIINIQYLYLSGIDSAEINNFICGIKNFRRAISSD
jgi:hypothetical protein